MLNSIIIPIVLTDKASTTSSTVPFKLSKKDKEDYENGGWLDDQVINVAQSLLKQQFPAIDGFHSTLLVAANQAGVLRGGAIQLLHVRSNHWICVRVGLDSASVQIYDSLYSTIPLSVVDLIINLVHPQQKDLQFRSMVMQQQNGFADCGVFAIATATALCNGEDATVVRWRQPTMRTHLMHCLEDRRMKPFPRSADDKSGMGQIKKSVVYAIHCNCRQRHRRKETMKQCVACGVWFHQKCLNIPKHALAATYQWTCSNCH